MPYLNGRPLVAMFEQPDVACQVEVTIATPSRLADLLEAEALDVALVSSVEAFRRPEVAAVDGIGISADGPVRSVRLLSNVPFSAIRTVAADEGSLTSVALARILLEAHYGVRPEFLSMPPEPATMLERADAALVIGDIAMRPYTAEHVLDLGDSWKDLTGLPFVYALWVARSEEEAARARPLLHDAKAWGVSRLQDIARDWARRTHMDLMRIRDYLLNIICYDLQDPQKEALRRFEELCRRFGVYESTHGIHYV